MLTSCLRNYIPASPPRASLIVAVFAACIGLLDRSGNAQSANTVHLPVRHMFGGADLRFHEPLQLTSGTRVTLTRLEYLVTSVSLQQGDGSWKPLPESYFHLNPLEKAGSLAIDAPTSQSCQAIAFAIGVPPALNHQDPASWPAGHPLNVFECNLHWSWAQGYVFLALEGNSQRGAAPRKTFLYHLGNDPLLMNIRLPLPEGVSPADCELVFHVDRIWNAATPVDPQDGGGVTHSAATDNLAPGLARNVEGAWELRRRAK